MLTIQIHFMQIVQLMEIILSKSFYSIIKYNDLTAVIRNIIPGG